MPPPTEDSSTAAPGPPEQGASLPPGQAAALPQASAPPWGLSFYLFVEPFGIGRVVVDLSGGGGPGAEILRKAGAVQVLFARSEALPLPYPDAAADVVLCPLSAAAAADDGARAALFAEIRRILRPDGMCVARVLASTLASRATGTSARATLADMVLEHFATVDIVEETPFRAVSFFAPTSDELAVSEAMAKVAGQPSHFIALGTAAGERTWQLTESLLVPTGPLEEENANQAELGAWRAEVERLSERVAEVTREREALRERLMTSQDRLERQTSTFSTMRRDIERYLRQVSDEAAARELLSLERDQVRRKLAKAEDEIESKAREIERQRSSMHALRKEVARLRAARGPVAGTGRGTT